MYGLYFFGLHISSTEGDTHKHRDKGSAGSQLSQAGICILILGPCVLCFKRQREGLVYLLHNGQQMEYEGRYIRTPNLLSWSQTRWRCAIPPSVFTACLAELANMCCLIDKALLSGFTH